MLMDLASISWQPASSPQDLGDMSVNEVWEFMVVAKLGRCYQLGERQCIAGPGNEPIVSVAAGGIPPSLGGCRARTLAT